jgi:hypothetical protein
MLAWCACPTASTYSTAAIAIANVRIISFPSLNCLRSLPKHSDAWSAIETNDSVPNVRSTENLAIRAAWPYIFGNIVRVAYAYQEDRARHGSRAIAAQATACRERQ